MAVPAVPARQPIHQLLLLPSSPKQCRARVAGRQSTLAATLYRHPDWPQHGTVQTYILAVAGRAQAAEHTIVNGPRTFAPTMGHNSRARATAGKGQHRQQAAEWATPTHGPSAATAYRAGSIMRTQKVHLWCRPPGGPARPACKPARKPARARTYDVQPVQPSQPSQAEATATAVQIEHYGSISGSSRMVHESSMTVNQLPTTNYQLPIYLCDRQRPEMTRRTAGHYSSRRKRNPGSRLGRQAAPHKARRPRPKNKLLLPKK